MLRVDVGHRVNVKFCVELEKIRYRNVRFVEASLW